MTFRTPSDGGRLIPPVHLSGRTYRPHIVIGPLDQKRAFPAERDRLTEDYLGVSFFSGPEHAQAGQMFTAQAALLYWPEVDYSAAVPGATFTLREGSQIVAHGRITKRWTESG